ncbi:MAG: hypothetical protein Ct9H300mP1_05930 [Planctomycetaceae bacterium]|nr:MAG: hypothetical protein Ct9H300mP1_05930 [Planctomycetaceae bacterium]
MMVGREGNASEKPALAFLKARAGSLDDLTVDTSVLFFGVNVSCAKCHDHPWSTTGSRITFTAWPRSSLAHT